MNLPNRLTMIRFILAIPFIIFLQYSDSSKYGLIFRLISLVIFVIASLTDFFDGYIARKYNLITDFGKIMDPLADKIHLQLKVHLQLCQLFLVRFQKYEVDLLYQVKFP